MNTITYIVETLKYGRALAIQTFTSEKLYTQAKQLLLILTLGSRASTKNNEAKKPNY